MGKLIELPEELFLNIFHRLDLQGLTAVCHTNSKFRRICNPILSRCIVVSEAKVSYERHAKLALHTVLYPDSFAPYVQQLNITLDNPMAQWPYVSPLETKARRNPHIVEIEEELLKNKRSENDIHAFFLRGLKAIGYHALPAIFMSHMSNLQRLILSLKHNGLSSRFLVLAMFKFPEVYSRKLHTLILRRGFDFQISQQTGILVAAASFKGLKAIRYLDNYEQSTEIDYFTLNDGYDSEDDWIPESAAEDGDNSNDKDYGLADDEDDDDDDAMDIDNGDDEEEEKEDDEEEDEEEEEDDEDTDSDVKEEFDESFEFTDEHLHGEDQEVGSLGSIFEEFLKKELLIKTGDGSTESADQPSVPYFGLAPRHPGTLDTILISIIEAEQGSVNSTISQILNMSGDLKSLSINIDFGCSTFGAKNTEATQTYLDIVCAWTLQHSSTLKRFKIYAEPGENFPLLPKFSELQVLEDTELHILGGTERHFQSISDSERFLEEYKSDTVKKLIITLPAQDYRAKDLILATLRHAQRFFPRFETIEMHTWPLVADSVPELRRLYEITLDTMQAVKDQQGWGNGLPIKETNILLLHG